MESIENLKYAIFNEWTHDPPAGCVTIYYDTWFEGPDEVEPIIDEIINHIKDAIGYEEPDEEELENAECEDEIGGLNPADENGNLSLDAISCWDWDNGGSGCGCTVYAEGIDIVDTVIDFCEDTLLDWVEDVDFDEDTIELDFTVMISPSKWEGSEVEISVPVTREEAGLLSLCAYEDDDINCFEGLENLVARIKATAIDEAYDSWEGTSEGEEFEDLGGASCSISGNPVEAEDFFRIAIDSIFEQARKNSSDCGAVKDFLSTVSEWIQNYNDSMF